MQLCVIEGDGIGREVIPAAVNVLCRIVPDLAVHRARAGWEHFQEHGTPLPQETIDLARESKAVLFGACNSPSYPVEGYYSPIVRLRRELKTFANMRPTRYLPIATARPGVDVLVVRENTEDLYVGDERTEAGGDTGTATKLITRAATERVAHMAFTTARKFGRKKITIVHKGNVLPQTDGLFRRVTFEVAGDYPDIEVDELLVDTAAYWMVKDPMRFDLVLTPNLYGDILSDMAAAWGGGLGLAPSINLGEDVCIAEPVHGSAPDIAGEGLANPTAAILSAALLLRHFWDMQEAADRVEEAVRSTLSEGGHTVDIYREDAISTEAFTGKVIAHLDDEL